MTITRRTLLYGAGAAAALAGPGVTRAMALARDYDGMLGLENAPAEGIGPVSMKCIHGRAPEGLEGVLYRNGPGWFRYKDDAADHWFDGDGFIQRFAIEDGKAVHSGRFAQTPKFIAEQKAGRFLAGGFGTRPAPGYRVARADDVNAANTSVIRAGGDLWALWEAGSPLALDPETLETRDFVTLRPDLKSMPFLAHPKQDPQGTIWNLGAGPGKALLWQVNPDGSLQKASLIPFEHPSYLHDWALSERYVILPMQPLLARLRGPTPLDQFEWAPDEPFRIALIEKDNPENQRIYELPAAFYFHTGDAWEDADGVVHFDLCVYDEPDFIKEDARDMLFGEYNRDAPKPYLAMISLHPDGRAEINRLGIAAEFPQTDRRRQGQARDLVAFVGNPAKERLGDTGIGLVNWRKEREEVFDFGDHQSVSEALFVPKGRGDGEEDSWLVATTLNLKAKKTELHVLDAANLKDGPVVSWRSRHATPYTFHGTWESL